mmetsp:Transcript_7693/g.16913  ORF Transcript_7693/g.16913 Transcript_7693/m.16913 type:complete len:215 (-) Transcript_7693:147-791(-)
MPPATIGALVGARRGTRSQRLSQHGSESQGAGGRRGSASGLHANGFSPERHGSHGVDPATARSAARKAVSQSDMRQRLRGSLEIPMAQAFDASMAQLMNMGLGDAQACRDALEIANGDVHTAAEHLLMQKRLSSEQEEGPSPREAIAEAIAMARAMGQSGLQTLGALQNNIGIPLSPLGVGNRGSMTTGRGTPRGRSKVGRAFKRMVSGHDHKV